MGWWSDIQKARGASSRLKEDAAAAEREYDQWLSSQSNADSQALQTASKHDDRVLRQTEPDTLTRIANEPPPPLQATERPKAHNIDPLDLNNRTPVGSDGGVHPGTTMLALSMDTLDFVSKVPLVDAILGARVNQVGEHGVPQPHPFEVGYRVQLRDPKQRASAAAQKRAQELQRWVFTCGDPRLKEFNTFENHLRSCVRDSLVYDQYCAEIVHGWGYKPAGVLGVDAKTIRRAKPTPKEFDALRYNPPGKGDKFVQVLNQQIVAEWGVDEFIFGVRNPRNDLRANGYGYPEIERLLKVIGDAVNALSYNAANFYNGTQAAGILALTSTMSKEMFDGFSEQVRALTSGASNAHRMLTLQLDPLAKEAMNFVNLHTNNREMEFSSWIGFLLKLVCAVYQMDPAEIGFVYGNEGQAGTLSQAGPGERIQSSKERGLRPLLRAIQTWWNYKIIYNLDPDFELVLAGFDKATELLKQEFLGKVVRTHWTVNEIRAIDDLPPLDTPAANAGPTDGVYQSALQWYEQMRQQQEQQAQQQQAAAAAMGPDDYLPTEPGAAPAAPVSEGPGLAPEAGAAAGGLQAPSAQREVAPEEVNLPAAAAALSDNSPNGDSLSPEELESIFGQVADQPEEEEPEPKNGKASTKVAKAILVHLN